MADFNLVIHPPVAIHTTLQVGQGPAGPPGPQGSGIVESFPGKTMVYTDNVLTEVLLYEDAEKVVLGKRKVLQYSEGKLTQVLVYDGVGVLLSTRSLTYTLDILTGVVDS